MSTDEQKEGPGVVRIGDRKIVTEINYDEDTGKTEKVNFFYDQNFVKYVPFFKLCVFDRLLRNTLSLRNEYRELWLNAKYKLDFC